MLASQSPVGTRGGVEWMRGPGACPRWGAPRSPHWIALPPGQARGPHPAPHPPLVPTGPHSVVNIHKDIPQAPETARPLPRRHRRHGLARTMVDPGSSLCWGVLSWGINSHPIPATNRPQKHDSWLAIYQIWRLGGQSSGIDSDGTPGHQHREIAGAEKCHAPHVIRHADTSERLRLKCTGYQS